MFDMNAYSIAVFGQPLSYFGDPAYTEPTNREDYEYLDSDEPMMEEVPC